MRESSNENSLLGSFFMSEILQEEIKREKGCAQRSGVREIFQENFFSGYNMIK